MHLLRERWNRRIAKLCVSAPSRESRDENLLEAFYADRVGFVADYDHTVPDEMRFVQLTPPGSVCSIALGKGIVKTEPGSVHGMQLVVPTSRRRTRT